MKRKNFLLASALLGAGATGGLSAFVLRTASSAARQADVVDVTLTAAPYVFSPAPGLAFGGFAYNGQVPGPVIRVRKGQHLRTRFVNHLRDQSTIHWHGMILPNAMDGVPGMTQRAVPSGSHFTYEFDAYPSGTRWYHSHFREQVAFGLFGALIVEDPSEPAADHDIVLVFHDVPDVRSLTAAIKDVSSAGMEDPADSPEMTGMRMDHRMGDESAYRAHCINGASYPRTKPLEAAVGQRVRLRVINASPTQTHYIRLAEHALRVTHADGNPLAVPVDVDALRIGIGERYDAWFELKKPGAWLLQSISSSALAFGQSLIVRTPGATDAPIGSPMSVADIRYFTYVLAGGKASASTDFGRIDVRRHYELAGGKWGDPRWTMNGKISPDIPMIMVRSGQRVLVTFTNKSDMEHPMHLHGHTFDVVSVNGVRLARPLSKDVSLVPANGGTLAWIFEANSPPGKWMLHCHNAVHQADGMMTEVQYFPSSV